MNFKSHTVRKRTFNRLLSPVLVFVMAMGYVPGSNCAAIATDLPLAVMKSGGTGGSVSQSPPKGQTYTLTSLRQMLLQVWPPG